jgi:hypothetical protein
MLVKITKISAAPNAGFLPANWADMVPGEQLPTGKSLPANYELEGTLLAPILSGQQFIAFRHDRNGVSALGLFCSSPVEEVLVVTGNSVYRLRALEESGTPGPNRATASPRAG